VCRGASWRTLALAAVVGTAGCAGTAPVAPSSPAAAMVRHAGPAAGQPSAQLLWRADVAPGDRLLLLRAVDAERCAPMEWLQAGVGPQQPGLAGAAAVPPAAAPSAPGPRADASPPRVAAGVPTTLEFRLQRADRSGCAAVFTYTPQSGHRYLVQAASVGAGCRVQLLDITRPEQARPPDDLLQRSVDNQRCVPLAQARGVGGGPSVGGGQLDGEPVLDPRATDAPLRGLIVR
jgi:hypothetical protein